MMIINIDRYTNGHCGLHKAQYGDNNYGNSFSTYMGNSNDNNDDCGGTLMKCYSV